LVFGDFVVVMLGHAPFLLFPLPRR
jgi:hypothetical protein